MRELRNDTAETVDRVDGATATRSPPRRRSSSAPAIQLEAREAELAAARDQKAAALDAVQRATSTSSRATSRDLQDQIQATDPAGERHPGVAPLPAGPIQGASGGWIWPVNGPLDLAVRLRWGRMHEGIDIAVPAGTPIRAAKAGHRDPRRATTGGYGNYTCVDHGGGLSTCYAHQSSFAISSGDQVDQGEVIGYSGCTGSCFGHHLHFEIRVNGTAVDPLGYL